MRRRNFIKVSSALTLASSVPLVGFVSGNKQSFRKNKIGLSSYSFWHFDSSVKPTMNYCIDKASAMGFDGIEFLLVQMSSVDNNHLQNLKKQAFDVGLDIMGLSTHQGFVNPSKEYRDKNIKKTIDANVRYKLNKIVPYDNISKKEYPFIISLYNKEVCVFLDLQNAESCKCN